MIGQTETMDVEPFEKIIGRYNKDSEQNMALLENPTLMNLCKQLRIDHI